MHTNLFNEIKGTYTKADWLADLIVPIILIGMAFAAGVIVFNTLGGAEALLAYVESL
jgi:hypothetical protein